MSKAVADSGAPQRKLKILMLHGYTQSGPIFHGRTKALEKALNKAFPASPKGPKAVGTPLIQYPGGIQLLYPTGPKRLRTSDIPGFVPSDEPANEQITDNYGWWTHNSTGTRAGEYGGFEQSFDAIASSIREAGGIDAVIGFSQGAAAASMVASLLEPGRRAAFDAAAAQGDGAMPYPPSFVDGDALVNPPLKFAAVYCGFAPRYSEYRAFYDPPISTPTLHVLGTIDTVVDEARSLDLAARCSDATTLYHPGGHFLPVTKDMLAALIGFIRDKCDDVQKDSKAGESVESMDVPI